MWEESKDKNIHRIINSSTAEGVKYKNTLRPEGEWGNKSHNLSLDSSSLAEIRTAVLSFVWRSRASARRQAVMFKGEMKSAVQRIVRASSNCVQTGDVKCSFSASCYKDFM